MIFVISGRVTPEVGAESGRLSKKFQDEMARMLVSDGLTRAPRSIVLFPTILNPEVATLADHVTYKRDGSIFVALGIPYERWTRATSLERIDLLAENICASVGKIKETRLDSDDRAKLLRIAEDARMILREQQLLS